MRPFFIFIWFFYFFICSSGVSFSEEFSNLSGKYKDYNVILIILDALRPDHLSCYGYTKETSPNIDRLAKEGVIFTNAFSQSHNTLPGVVSVFTSLYPFSHCVEHIFKDRIPDNIYTLADVLNIYGYKTFWFGNINDPHTGMAKNVLKGFNEKYDLKKDYGQVFGIMKKYRNEHFFITIHSYSTHEQSLLGYKSGDYYDNFNIFFERLKSYYAKTWEEIYYTCKNNPEKLDEFFGEGWSEKNAEYFALPYSNENFDRVCELLDSKVKRYIFKKIIKFDSAYSFLFSLDDKDILILLSLLDSVIYELDKDLIGGLIKALKENNLYDKTIIIITADHSNEYREHGNIGHGNIRHDPHLYDEIIKVPFIFHIPLLNKAMRIDNLIQSIDILPTVLELLNIPAPYNAQGISLVGQIEGKSGAVANDYIFAKTIPGSLAIRSKQYKLIQHNAEDTNFSYELYNLQNDSLEKNNLINIEPGMARILKAALEAKISSHPAYNRKKSEYVPEIDPQGRENIKRTGYW